MVALEGCADKGKVKPKEHASCAAKLDRDDELLVFVSFSDKKILDIADESVVEEFIGKEVVIKGWIDQGFIEIENIRAK